MRRFSWRSPKQQLRCICRLCECQLMMKQPVEKFPLWGWWAPPTTPLLCELGSLPGRPGWWVTAASVSWPLSAIQRELITSHSLWHNVNSVEVSEHAKTHAGTTCWDDSETRRNDLIIGDPVTELICSPDASVITTVSKVHEPVPNNNAGSCKSLDLWLLPLCLCSRRGRSSVKTKTPQHITRAEDVRASQQCVSLAMTHVLCRDFIYSVFCFLTSSKLI